MERLTLPQPYTAYTYAYPHKTAYRPLGARSLSSVWSGEDVQSLFLYVHVPFCEYRCGFCNLFTTTRAADELVDRYLASLECHMQAVRAALPHARFARLAIGGGTPTYLNAPQLERLLAAISLTFDVDAHRIPVSCEASPATIDRDKLDILQAWGVDRLSLGIQSFNADRLKAMGRPQRADEVESALQLLDNASFATRNVDLIYGAEDQTLAAWLVDVERAIEYGVEELFLYPLYVRRLTGLGLRHDGVAQEQSHLEDWDHQRLAAYNAARDRLLNSGYKQLSMRNFVQSHARQAAPDYCCQLDGMLGIGCGARSYTRELHYSNEYAVGSTAVKNILSGYMQRTSREFTTVDYGFELDSEEQRRRFLLMSILQTAGLDRQRYAERFGDDVLDDFQQLQQLAESELCTIEPDRVRLTDEGLMLSDAIGPWLYSTRVMELCGAYQWQ